MIGDDAQPRIDEFVTFLYVADLEASHRFYHGVLGLDLVLDQGACRIYRITETGYVGVCSHRDPEPRGTIVTIVSDDVDGWFATVAAAGVATDGSPRRNEQFGIYHFFAEDPDGHHIEFQRFGPEWPGPRARG